jgi:hypothetical protein
MLVRVWARSPGPREGVAGIIMLVRVNTGMSTHTITL